MLAGRPHPRASLAHAARCDSVNTVPRRFGWPSLTYFLTRIYIMFQHAYRRFLCAGMVARVVVGGSWLLSQLNSPAGVDSDCRNSTLQPGSTPTAGAWHAQHMAHCGIAVYMYEISMYHMDLVGAKQCHYAQVSCDALALVHL